MKTTEFIDYENMLRISNELKTIASNIEETLNNINNYMQNIDKEDYFKSN